MGLPQDYRLRYRDNFKAIYQQGKRYNGTHLVVIALSESSEANQSLLVPTRFGISISQKVSKKAVIRNRIKRQIRGAIRELLREVRPRWKVIIVVRPSALQCNYEHFLRELKQLFIQSGVIHGN